MEHRVNKRLSEMTVLDLAWFKVILEWEKEDIIALQLWQKFTFLVPTDVKSEEEEEVLYDITREPIDSKGKGKRKRS